MIKNNLRKFLVIVLGPTAVGKTAMAVRLAKYFNTDVVSADSRQFYRGMIIGTATPTVEEMQGIRHHFIGSLSIDEYFNVSIFEQQVLGLLDELFREKEIVVMAGGSGLYIDAVCHGIDDFPDADMNTRDALKKEMHENGLQPLLERLEKLDPEYFRIVDRNNPNRVLRALEVCLATGRTFTEQRTSPQKERDFLILKIGVNTDRETLFQKISDRVDEMIDMGLIEEARRLFPYRGLNALNTVGYKELFDHFEGKCALEEAIEKIKTNTRRYAKRQLTWFKRDEDIKWFRPEEYGEIIGWIEKNRRSGFK